MSGIETSTQKYCYKFNVKFIDYNDHGYNTVTRLIKEDFGIKDLDYIISESVHSVTTNLVPSKAVVDLLVATGEEAFNEVLPTQNMKLVSYVFDRCEVVFDEEESL